MSKLNNPAGRLHELLTAFRDHSGTGTSINDAWVQTLGIEADELLPTLGRVAAMLGEIREAVTRSQRQELEALHAQFASAWAVPIFSHGRNPAQDASHSLVDASALVALGSLALNLEVMASGGAVPTDEVEAEIKADLRDLLEQLNSDSQLHPILRAAIAARVHDILWAVDHVEIVGPDGVEAAVERLVGQLAIFTADEPAARTTGIFQRTMQSAARAWSAFRAGGDAAKAMEGWQKVFELLPPS